MSDSLAQAIATLGDEICGVLARTTPSRVIEVSRSGCLLESGNRVDEGTVGELRVQIRDQVLFDDVRVTRCVRVEGFGSRYLVGAEFLQTRPPDERSIRRALAGILRGFTALEPTPMKLVKKTGQAEAQAAATNGNVRHREEGVMKELFTRLVREDEGQDLIEYGLLAGLITTAVVAAITAIGTRVLQLFTDLQGAVESAPGGGS
jgi:pilus assembly protein Flp/PilA